MAERLILFSKSRLNLYERSYRLEVHSFQILTFIVTETALLSSTLLRILQLSLLCGIFYAFESFIGYHRPDRWRWGHQLLNFLFGAFGLDHEVFGCDLFRSISNSEFHASLSYVWFFSILRAVRWVINFPLLLIARWNHRLEVFWSYPFAWVSLSRKSSLEVLCIEWFKRNYMCTFDLTPYALYFRLRHHDGHFERCLIRCANVSRH